MATSAVRNVGASDSRVTLTITASGTRISNYDGPENKQTAIRHMETERGVRSRSTGSRTYLVVELQTLRVQMQLMVGQHRRDKLCRGRTIMRHPRSVTHPFRTATHKRPQTHTHMCGEA